MSDVAKVYTFCVQKLYKLFKMIKCNVITSCTSYPRCSVDDVRQLATVGVQVTGSCDIRCWQRQQVCHYFPMGGDLKLRQKGERKRGKESTIPLEFNDNI